MAPRPGLNFARLAPGTAGKGNRGGLQTPISIETYGKCVVYLPNIAEPFLGAPATGSYFLLVPATIGKDFSQKWCQGGV